MCRLGCRATIIAASRDMMRETGFVLGCGLRRCVGIRAGRRRKTDHDHDERSSEPAHGGCAPAFLLGPAVISKHEFVVLPEHKPETSLE